MIKVFLQKSPHTPIFPDFSYPLSHWFFLPIFHLHQSISWYTFFLDFDFLLNFHLYHFIHINYPSGSIHFLSVCLIFSLCFRLPSDFSSASVHWHPLSGWLTAFLQFEKENVCGSPSASPANRFHRPPNKSHRYFIKLGQSRPSGRNRGARIQFKRVHLRSYFMYYELCNWSIYKTNIWR